MRDLSTSRPVSLNTLICTRCMRRFAHTEQADDECEGWWWQREYQIQVYQCHLVEGGILTSSLCTSTLRNTYRLWIFDAIQHTLWGRLHWLWKVFRPLHFLHTFLPINSIHNNSDKA